MAATSGSVRWCCRCATSSRAARRSSCRQATAQCNPELFFGAIGGYGALGVVCEVELELADNKRVKRVDKVMPLADYWTHFKNTVRNNPKAVFHNADLYAPHFSTAALGDLGRDRCAGDHGGPLADRCASSYPLHQYFLWAISETPLGKQRREQLIDPLLYLRKKVHWRNYEAGYDVAELEPPSALAPHLRAAGVLRAGREAGGLRAADGGHPAAPWRQRAQRVDPPCDARRARRCSPGRRPRPSPSCCITSSARARTRRAASACGRAS